MPKELWKKGQSGNPNGRPKDSFSLLTLLKKELKKIPKHLSTKEKKTYAVLMVEKMLDKAIKEGDHSTHKLIMNYLEGMPKQSIEMGGVDGEPIKLGVVQLPERDFKKLKEDDL